LKRRGLWWAGALWIVFLTLMSLQPIRPNGLGTGPGHIVLHIVLFASAASVPLLLAEDGWHEAARAFCLICFAACVEIAQSALYRKPIEWSDVGFDAVGVLGVFAAVRVYRFIPR
jgi:hypothetical protein